MGDQEDAIIAALLQMLVLFGALLPPMYLITAAMRRYLALKRFGSAKLSAIQRRAISDEHWQYRAVANATALVALMLGAVLVQMGYMLSFGPIHETYLYSPDRFLMN